MVDQYKRKTGTIQKVCLIRPQINEDMQELPDFSPKMLLIFQLQLCEIVFSDHLLAYVYF